jgi:hypothetical protein
MAIVGDIPITLDQLREFWAWSTDEPTLRISVWPDGVTVDDGDTVVVSFQLTDEAQEELRKGVPIR